jgi:hypothetical protein
MKKQLLALILIGMFAPCLVLAKDVYVSAGSKGNGTKGKPYNDISDALNMGVYAGDVIHVAEGVYYGEGGSGKWLIKVKNLTIAGGYKKDFSERDPWKYQSILVRAMGADALDEAKKREHNKKWGLDLAVTKASYNGGAMVSGEGDNSNTIIDGFVIDGYTRNTYKKNGDLNTAVGPIGNGGPLVSFNRPGCKVRNCMIMNSGGPGILMVASGKKEDPNSWQEISNNVIVNTLMEAIEFRAGTWDPVNDPDGGFALIKNNTVAFVWTHLGEGYGVIIGRQTKLQIENNIFAFATDFGMNNGFGNDKAKLNGNVFFNNMGGVYRYWASSGSKTTVVVDDPALLTGKQGNKMYYVSAKSEGNVSADPKLKVDPEFFDKFSNQIRSEGGGKVVWDDVNQWRSIMGLPLIGSKGTGKSNFAPIYEHKYAILASDAVAAGMKTDATLAVYKSTAAEAVAKDYVKIRFEDVKSNFGKDVTVSVRVGDKDSGTSYYVDGVTKADWSCFRYKEDRMNFIYVKNSSEEMEIITKAIKDGSAVMVSGKLVDISAAIKSSNRFGIVVDKAEVDE